MLLLILDAIIRRAAQAKPKALYVLSKLNNEVLKEIDDIMGTKPEMPQY